MGKPPAGAQTGGKDRMLSDFAFGGLTCVSFFAMQSHNAKNYPLKTQIFSL
jgi:hypothetical protein